MDGSITVLFGKKPAGSGVSIQISENRAGNTTKHRAWPSKVENPFSRFSLTPMLMLNNKTRGVLKEPQHKPASAAYRPACVTLREIAGHEGPRSTWILRLRFAMRRVTGRGLLCRHFSHIQEEPRWGRRRRKQA